MTQSSSAQIKDQDIETQFDDAVEKLASAREEIQKVIFGQEKIIDLTLTTLLSGGHVLLVGVPGLAKTLLVETVADVMGLSSARIQCTPDLMPSDIIGAEILDQDDSGKRKFRFVKGPVFTQLLMADEINRASPRTQSALLQAMQERQVSAAGKTHTLPQPFHVLATQNPIEQEGTYPLPEAQRDRFFMEIDVDYPSREAERELLQATTGSGTSKAQPVFKKDDLAELQSLVRALPVGEQVVDAILHIVRHARPGESNSNLVTQYVEWAPGPRASQALMLGCRAKALLEGRSAPSTDDVIALAEPILKHRMALNFHARTDQISITDIVRDLTKDL